MSSLDEATTAREGTLSIDDTWLQGRGAYGGLVIAALVREIERVIGDPQRRVRSVSAQIPAPTVPGAATIDVDVLRSGSNLTAARATMRQSTTITAHAAVVLASTRESARDVGWQEIAGPVLPPYASVAPVPTDSPYAAVFARHFEYRIASGLPGAGGDAVTIGWLRARQPGVRRDAAYVAAMIDAWYPAFLIRSPRPRPLATIAFELELLGDPASLGDDPLIYRGSVPVCRDGYFQETRELWTGDGQLIALNHQTFAIIQ